MRSKLQTIQQLLKIIPNPDGVLVEAAGWVRHVRSSAKVGVFIELSDGSCDQSLQLLVPKSHPAYPTAQRLTCGCSLKVEGLLVSTPAGTLQPVELSVTSLVVLGWVESPDTYPVAAKNHSLEHLRSVAHLRPRTRLMGAISRIRHQAAQQIHQFFDQAGFLWVPTPIITSADCEGAGEIFQITRNSEARDTTGASAEFFGKPAFLTVSGQLNGEAYACALSKVYTFGPTFRAENSNTSRHLSEFWMVEPEAAFMDLNGLTTLAVDLLQFVFKGILEGAEADLAYLEQKTEKPLRLRLQEVLEREVTQLEYTDAIEILLSSQQDFEFPVYWGCDLASEHERFLAEKYCKSLVIVKNYPKEIKAFYMRLNEDRRTVAAMDVLAPGIGEIIGGSQREERLAYLLEKMELMDLDTQTYSWYIDLRRFGTVPHSGFGLGFDRILSYLTGMDNLRDVSPFPRAPNQLGF